MQDGAHGEKHAEVVAHLAVVLEGRMEVGREESHADESPVGEAERGDAAAAGVGADAPETVDPVDDWAAW